MSKRGQPAGQEKPPVWLKGVKAVLEEAGKKWCPGCRQWKSLLKFYNHKKRLDGKQSYCSECTQRAVARAIRPLAQQRKETREDREFFQQNGWE